jgi:hypothetical protein
MDEQEELFEDLPEDTELDIPNAADPIAVGKQVERAKKKKDEGREFWATCLNSVIGRQEIWGMLVGLGTFEDKFAISPNGFPQQEATWFNAGQKSFGLRFYHSLIIINRELVFKMHDENDSRFAKPKRRRVVNDD